MVQPTAALARYVVDPIDSHRPQGVAVKQRLFKDALERLFGAFGCFHYIGICEHEHASSEQY